jgi:hypothetical protein
VILNLIKAEFRYRTWDGSELGLGEKASILFDVLESSAMPWSTEYDGGVRNIARLSHILTFAIVVDRTPSAVPYWGGETLIPIFSKPIPRILWPGKPEEVLGNTFWKNYAGVMSDDDYVTSYNLPWLPELYANFGWLGVVIGMIVIGVAFRYLVEKFRADDGVEARFIFGLALFFNLFWAESNISLMFGGLLLNFLALLVTFKILSTICARRVGRSVLSWRG